MLQSSCDRTPDTMFEDEERRDDISQEPQPVDDQLSEMKSMMRG